LLAAAVFWSATAAARAAFTVPGFELVYTAPIETTLQRPELRSAAAVWPELLDSARQTIDIAEFYVAVTTRSGEPLDPVIAALRRAGARGVRIRFLAEKKMARISEEGFARLRDIPNLELRVIDFSQIKKDGIVHAKYMVIDNRTAYVGSQNFDWRSLKHIHEMGLLISEADIVAAAGKIFEQDWKAQALSASGKPVLPLQKTRPAAAADRRAYLVASPWSFNPPGVGDSELELTRLIETANDNLSIQLLDYAPLSRDRRFYPPIDNALRDAAVRGVRVKLMVSNWNTASPEIAHLKSLSLVPGIEVRIVTIPESSDGFIPFARVIHSKYMVIDGNALWLGTSNWSGGYLDNSRNLEVVVKDEALARETLEIHHQLWTSAYSQPIDIAKNYPRPRK